MLNDLPITENVTIEKMDEKTLIEVARTGDRDAFGELVKRYRNQAMNWAQKFSRDTHMAEDIVQEALINAFLHMGTLIDVNRFQAWLKKIVHNQALMKLRKTNTYRHEHLFTQIEEEYNNDSTFDVFNLEHIIYRLSLNVLNDSQIINPESLMLKKEMIDGIRYLLYCLSPKERQVFEAYFFEQISPTEIAQIFNVSVGSIYTTLSRSRKKVRKERTRIYLIGYFKNHLDKESEKRKVLETPQFI